MNDLLMAIPMFRTSVRYSSAGIIQIRFYGSAEFVHPLSPAFRAPPINFDVEIKVSAGNQSIIPMLGSIASSPRLPHFLPSLQCFAMGTTDIGPRHNFVRSVSRPADQINLALSCLFIASENDPNLDVPLVYGSNQRDHGANPPEGSEPVLVLRFVVLAQRAVVRRIGFSRQRWELLRHPKQPAEPSPRPQTGNPDYSRSSLHGNR